MTQKELLYVEDAISHEDIIIKTLDEMTNTLEDDKLVSFIDKQIGKHNNIKTKLIKLLEEKVNE